MKKYLLYLLSLSLMLCGMTIAHAENQIMRLQELDAFWEEISRTVREGDFDSYKATYTDDAVLVSGPDKTSYPIKHAFERWEKGFLDTEAGRMQASVEFRFNQRLGDDTTAHESGIFMYSSVDESNNITKGYMSFEALLIKKDRWLMNMEYQKYTSNEEEWNKLK